MGNREDLLAGAKRCLYEKGYARTTARDIATAAGTSLAAIGYHFKSTETLLNQALVESMSEWGDELERALTGGSSSGPGSGSGSGSGEAEAEATGGAEATGTAGHPRPATDPATVTPRHRFEATWDRVIASFPEHRPLWATQFELVSRIDQVPQMREFFAGAQDEARRGLAAIFQGVAPDSDTASEVGAFYQALLTGVMVQCLVDPEHVPSGPQLAAALRTVAASLDTPTSG
ncbi:TetR/AcrR family transcriptional regulator [Longispora sp. NPDC051575]|uniref:TetR/AcrR family transcriptional regulator n=1 Tax=Longispora sp. NPDC051575 TaxID=3154943 RepID=UPI0034251F5F